MANTPQEEWEAYRERELSWIRSALAVVGYTLDEHQPHVGGERYLMQAVTTASGRKLILYATRASDGKRAVVKATSDAAGIHELEHERLCRARLADIRFAYRGFPVPEELLFRKADGKAFSIQAYIEQEKNFLARSTPEQFTLALSAFKTQEGAHAATYEQQHAISRTFGSMRTEEYLTRFAAFRKTSTDINDSGPRDELLAEAEAFLQAHEGTIRQYEGFLTHTDFVPHNIRIVGNDIYLLDASSLRFGNKYEGWARFVNFMELYNPELARVLVQYVADNRTSEESLALRLMRVYRLGEIIAYYAGTLPRSTGDLFMLNRARMEFWSEVLRVVLKGTHPEPATVLEYQKLRDRLRSPEEKVRQKNLH